MSQPILTYIHDTAHIFNAICMKVGTDNITHAHIDSDRDISLANIYPNPLRNPLLFLYLNGNN